VPSYLRAAQAGLPQCGPFRSPGCAEPSRGADPAGDLQEKRDKSAASGQGCVLCQRSAAGVSVGPGGGRAAAPGA